MLFTIESRCCLQLSSRTKSGGGAMHRFHWLKYFGLLTCFFAGFCASSAAAQNPDALSNFFEGKQVVVKIDMPGTQKGVEIYPERPQPLDAKSYGDRLKQFG